MAEADVVVFEHKTFFQKLFQIINSQCYSHLPDLDAARTCKGVFSLTQEQAMSLDRHGGLLPAV